ncbi:MAG TPA: hypothetical protein PKY82_02440 [Pyrinomonadaceae bacterium]|nr:hypothetical protein [Pyrinomonadaceae bacterium]
MNSLQMLRASGALGIIIVLLLFAVIGFLLYRKQSARYKKKADIFKKYQQSLSRLRTNPNDAELKQRTITLGRTYSNLTRNKNGDIAFDEMALMNEINAACANAQPVQFQNSTTKSTIQERLLQLQKLKEQNLLSDNEYNARRQQILNEI